MDLTRLDEQVELLQNLGFTLNIEEKLRLRLAQNSLLSANQELDELKLWGRIQGLTKTYYVLSGLRYRKSYEFPHKTFYYALSSDFEFRELPDLLVQHDGLSEKFNAMPFVGDPAKVLVNVEGEGEGEGEAQPKEEDPNGQGKPKGDEEEEEIKKVPKKNFTELNRLSYVVKSVENDVQCVPREAYKMTPEHELRPNGHFYGLTIDNARRLDHWQHFRSPVGAEGRRAIEDDHVVFSSAFLDTLEGDAPHGSWSLQLNSQLSTVTVRSFKWPGYFAFHKLGSFLHGGIYLGTGAKNIDLPFMI